MTTVTLSNAQLILVYTIFRGGNAMADTRGKRDVALVHGCLPCVFRHRRRAAPARLADAAGLLRDPGPAVGDARALAADEPAGGGDGRQQEPHLPRRGAAGGARL